MLRCVVFQMTDCLSRFFCPALLGVLLVMNTGNASPLPPDSRFDKEPISRREVINMLTLSIIILRVNDGATREWIAGQAQNKTLATQGEWALSWLGENHRHGVSGAIFQHQSDNTFAIAFKGQNAKNMDDVYHGLGIQWQDEWPYFENGRCSATSKNQAQDLCPAMILPVPGNEPVITGAVHEGVAPVDWFSHIAISESDNLLNSSSGKMKIAAGAKNYVKALLQLKDFFETQVSGEFIKSDMSVTITGAVEYLIEQTSPTAKAPLTLYVTGDSLGGTAAVLAGTYLYQWLKMQDIPPGSVRLRISVTNAPGLYNAAFVSFYNRMVDDRELPVSQQFYRLQHDIVSNYFAFNLQGLAGGIVNATNWLRDRVQWFIAGSVSEYLRLTGQVYAQVGLAQNQTITSVVNKADPRRYNLPEQVATFKDLIHYYEFNHFSSSLLTSLGAPLVPCPPGGCIGGEQ